MTQRKRDTPTLRQVYQLKPFSKNQMPCFVWKNKKGYVFCCFCLFVWFLHDFRVAYITSFMPHAFVKKQESTQQLLSQPILHPRPPIPRWDEAYTDSISLFFLCAIHLFINFSFNPCLSLFPSCKESVLIIQSG